MSLNKDGRPLYNAFKDYTYPELEELLYNSKDQDEKDFYAGLCEFYLAKKQKRVMREKPF